MDELMVAQAQYDDIRRQLSVMDRRGWYLDLPKTRRPVRLRVAQALVNLAARLTPTIPTAPPQPRPA